MYRKYKDRADFYVVYIQEAHSSDGWQLPINEKQSVIYADPKTDAERVAVADACVRGLKIEIPALIDNIDNSTEKAYSAWPDRLYVIDKQGRIAFKSAPGPFGFSPEQTEEALRKTL